MKKLFYILGGIFAVSFFTAYGNENSQAAQVTQASGTEDAPNLLESAETDLTRALMLAEDGDRIVFVEFTGSDWCPPCKALRKNILSTPEFAKFVRSKNAIFVELDFPRDKGKFPEEVMKEREKIALLYNVQGFPTMLVLDKNGAAYVKIVGGSRDIPSYVKKLDDGCALLNKFSEAVKAAGDNAEALVNALNMLPPELQSQQKALIERIIKADKEDRFGFAEKQRIAALEVGQREMLKAFFMKHSSKGMANIDPARLEALEILKQKDLQPFAKSALYKFISDGYAMQKNLPEALSYLKMARDATPDEKRKAYLTRWVGQLEKVISELENPQEATPEKVE